MTTASLYERLGGAKGIAQVVDDVIANYFKNPVVRTRFENTKDLDRLKKMAEQFLLRRRRQARRL